MLYLFIERGSRLPSAQGGRMVMRFVDFGFIFSVHKLVIDSEPMSER